MKKLYVVLLAVLLSVFTIIPQVFAAPRGTPTQYGRSALTGGGSGALDELQITGAGTPNTYDLAEGDSAQVVTISGTTANWYIYVFDADGTTAESSPTTIRPDDYATAGVWRLVGYGTGGNMVSANYELADATILKESEIDTITKVNTLIGDATLLDDGAIADSTAIGLDAGDTYTNYGDAADDSLNELLAAIDTALGSATGLTDEASLYAALSDVSLFYEPGDTIQTNSGTTLPATCTVGETFIDTDADTDGSLYVCVATNTWKENDDDGGAGGGDTITEGDSNVEVADSGSGVVHIDVDAENQIQIIDGYLQVINGFVFRPLLTTSGHTYSFQAYDNDGTTWVDLLTFTNGDNPSMTLPKVNLFMLNGATAFTGSDATPDVSAGSLFKSADTTTYTDFDDGTDHTDLEDGQQLVIFFQHAATMDCSSSQINCNGGTDFTAADGDIAICYFDDTTDADGQWLCDVRSSGGSGDITTVGDCTTGDCTDDFIQPGDMADADHGDFTYSGNVAGLDAGVVDASNLNDLYAYAEIPIAWMKDGTSAPAALDDASTRSPYVYRNFDSTADEDLEFNWFVPPDFSSTTTTIQYRVYYLITNATGPSATEGVAFGLSGVSAGDNDASNGTKGTVVVVTDDTLTAVQHDVMITGWSGDVTVTNIAAGEVAEMALIRDVSDAVDDYGQDVGVFMVQIRYVQDPAR